MIIRSDLVFGKLTPTLITIFRIVLAPVLFYTLLNDLFIYSLGIYLVAIISDAADGYFARKYNCTSSIGAYLDIIADFILVLAGFSAFVLNGVYPFWVLIIIIFMFLQFLITSKFQILIYDPVGKYYGLFLFLIIFINIIVNFTLLNYILTILLVLFSIISISSRFLFLFKDNKSAQKK